MSRIDWGDPFVKRCKRAWDLGYGRSDNPLLDCFSFYLACRETKRAEAEDRWHAKHCCLWRLLNPLHVNWYAG